jgi:hypothetical protein
MASADVAVPYTVPTATVPPAVTYAALVACCLCQCLVLFITFGCVGLFSRGRLRRRSAVTARRRWDLFRVRSSLPRTVVLLCVAATRVWFFALQLACRCYLLRMPVPLPTVDCPACLCTSCLCLSENYLLRAAAALPFPPPLSVERRWRGGDDGSCCETMIYYRHALPPPPAPAARWLPFVTFRCLFTRVLTAGRSYPAAVIRSHSWVGW